MISTILVSFLFGKFLRREHDGILELESRRMNCTFIYRSVKVVLRILGGASRGHVGEVVCKRINTGNTHPYCATTSPARISFQPIVNDILIDRTRYGKREIRRNVRIEKGRDDEIRINR